MARILQINLNHCVVAQDLLSQLVREEKTDVAVISEEYRDLENPNWVVDTNKKAAIWVCGSLHISRKISTAQYGFTWVEVAGVRL